MARENKRKPKTTADDPKKLNEASNAFASLSEQDKGILLRQNGIFFLQFSWRPTAPTPELRTVLNQLSRVSFLINRFMQQATMRRIEMEKLIAISESQIKEKMVQPVSELISAYSSDLQRILDGKQPNKIIDLKYQAPEPEEPTKESPESIQDTQKSDVQDKKRDPSAKKGEDAASSMNTEKKAEEEQVQADNTLHRSQKEKTPPKSKDLQTGADDNEEIN